ncbi:MAG TPA: hypothetical protein VKT53_02165 [Candidatus Acidoferrum sp.]|nr:hypothetical protein [Candidatus Acidoferrum sp.]
MNQTEQSSNCAYGEGVAASLYKEHKDASSVHVHGIGSRRFGCALVLGAAMMLGAGCDSTQTSNSSQSAAKPAEPAVPEDVQSAASAFLGKEATVLVFGDLAKTGTRQLLAANVVPKTPKNTLPGTIVTRAVLAEESNGSWHELMRCDEHLKNEKGYLGGSPIEPVAGWRIQFEQNAVEGFHLYLTPVKGNDDPHVLPLAVHWNPAVKRYQTLDRNYEHFLPEAASLGPARSHL